MTTATVPDWAAFFSEEAYARFISTVDAVVSQRGLGLELGEDGVYSGSGHAPRLHVRTLARECHNLPAEKWAERTRDMLDSMMRIHDEQQLVAEVASDWERAQPLVRVKLWPESALGAVERGELDVALRPLVSGLALGLALQLPGAVAAIKQADARGWSVSLDEAFDVGIANVRAAGKLEVEELPIDPEHPESGMAHTLFEGPYFLATHALFLEIYLDGEPEHGLLVVVPHAGAIIFHIIRAGSSFGAAVARLAGFAARAYQNAPRPLSPIVYWRRPAGAASAAGATGTVGAAGFRLEPLAVLQDDGLRFRPSERFVAEVETPLGLETDRIDAVVLSLAERSRELCEAMLERADGGELLRITPVAGGEAEGDRAEGDRAGAGELPFDPELGVSASVYWAYRDPKGRAIDMVEEMVFDSIDELVSATFVGPVEIEVARKKS